VTDATGQGCETIRRRRRDQGESPEAAAGDDGDEVRRSGSGWSGTNEPALRGKRSAWSDISIVEAPTVTAALHAFLRLRRRRRRQSPQGRATILRPRRERRRVELRGRIQTRAGDSIPFRQDRRWRRAGEEFDFAHAFDGLTSASRISTGRDAAVDQRELMGTLRRGGVRANANLKYPAAKSGRVRTCRRERLR